MEKKNYHRSVEVHASAEDTLKGIAQVNHWWAKKVKGNTQKLHDEFTVDFGKTFVDFKISELIPGKKVVWKVTDCNLDWINNKKEWNGNEVVFQLTEKKGKTQIDFTHFGLMPGAECYNDCEVGWNTHVGDSLVKFINEGQGMPV